jgi:hypothetical protein
VKPQEKTKPPGERRRKELILMSDYEDHSISSEITEDLRKLVRKAYETEGITPPSEEMIDFDCVVFMRVAWEANIPLWEVAKKMIGYEKNCAAIDAESKTLEERRKRREKYEIKVPMRAESSIDIEMEELEWLEAKTGCTIEEVHRLNSDIGRLALQIVRNENNPSEDVKKNVEHNKEAMIRSIVELEIAIGRGRKHLQSILDKQRQQNAKLFMNTPIKHFSPRARAASRARRSTTRQTGGGGSPGDEDNGESDPPEPGARAHHLSSVTSHSKGNKPRYLNWRRCRRCWRMGEGRRVA